MIGFFCPLTFITDPFKTPVSGYLPPPPPPPPPTYLLYFWISCLIRDLVVQNFLVLMVLPCVLVGNRLLWILWSIAFKIWRGWISYSRHRITSVLLGINLYFINYFFLLRALIITISKASTIIQVHNLLFSILKSESSEDQNIFMLSWVLKFIWPWGRTWPELMWDFLYSLFSSLCVDLHSFYYKGTDVIE